MHKEALKPQRNAGKSLPYTSGSWTLTCEGGDWDLEGASGLCKNFISQPRWWWQRCWPYHYLLTHVFVFVNSQTVCLCFMHFPVDIVFGQYQLSLKLRLTKTTVQERIKEKSTVRWPTAQATRNRNWEEDVPEETGGWPCPNIWNPRVGYPLGQRSPG